MYQCLLGSLEVGDGSVDLWMNECFGDTEIMGHEFGLLLRCVGDCRWLCVHCAWWLIWLWLRGRIDRCSPSTKSWAYNISKDILVLSSSKVSRRYFHFKVQARCQEMEYEISPDWRLPVIS